MYMQQILLSFDLTDAVLYIKALLDQILEYVSKI